MKKELMGYEFEDEDIKLAEQDIEVIRELSKGAQLDNIKIIQSMYNQHVEERTFHTVIGYEFMRKLQKELMHSGEIDKKQIKKIPINRVEAQPETPNPPRYAFPKLDFADSRDRYSRKSERQLEQEIERWKDKHTKSLICNLVFAVIIIGMFIIIEVTGRFDEKAQQAELEDRYIQWQQELESREAELNQRESQQK